MASAVQAADISGAGATFPYPMYSKWADAYKKQTGVGLNYQSIGSGGGIKQIKAKTVTFGASDMPLKPEELKEAGLVQFPMIIGGVVPVVNVKGVQAGQLTLDGATIAAHLPGRDHQVERPEDQEAEPEADAAGHWRSRRSIARTAPAPTSCSRTICPSRARSSRTTIGANTSVQWPVGIGAKGNEGVANMTTQTDGAIGYVEYAYAKQNKMAYARSINKDGKAVAPSAEAFQAAAANADWAKAPGYYLILTDQAGARAGRSPARASSWCTAAAGSGRDRRSAEVLRLGLQEWRARWPRSWTTCRCRRR